MGENTRESTNAIKSTVMESLPLKTEELMKDSGKTESKMAKEPTRKVPLSSKASGRMGNESLGLKKRKRIQERTLPLNTLQNDKLYNFIFT